MSQKSSKLLIKAKHANKEFSNQIILMQIEIFQKADV